MVNLHLPHVPGVEHAADTLKSVAHALGDADGEKEPRALLAVQSSELLDVLLNAAPTPGGRQRPRLLDPTILQQAKAVQFVFTQKSGVVLGRSATHGISLSKLGSNEDGSVRWSPPCFLVSDSLSLGLTFGAHQVATLCCIMSEQALTQLQSQGVLSGAAAEGHLTVAKAAHAAAALGASSPLPDVLTASHSEGLLVDLPLFKAGVLEVDVQKNGEVYGEEAAQEGPAAILGGGLPCPPEFAMLHKRLNDALSLGA